MKIIKQSTTPDGTLIRIENWNDDYDFMVKNATIGFYPKSLKDIYNEWKPYFSPYPRKNKTFRASFEFNSEKEALEAFVLLKNGCKTFMDYIDYFKYNTISKKDFIEAIQGGKNNEQL